MTQIISKVTAMTLGAALLATTFLMFAPNASASNHRGDDITVSNTNRATVNNTVEVEAETGDNKAIGGDSNRGGDGGNARGRNTTGGDGGNAGRGGNGGTITTGAALALGTIDNDINRNNTHVVGCGCDDDVFPFPPRFMRGWHGDDTTVRNSNSARVTNNLDVEAETGENKVNGGDGDRGGDGGDASRNNRNRFLSWFFNGGSATGGNGGNGSAGGNGGTVRTGTATADGLLTNVINRNITRIEPGDEDMVNPI